MDVRLNGSEIEISYVLNSEQTCFLSLELRRKHEKIAV